MEENQYVKFGYLVKEFIKQELAPDYKINRTFKEIGKVNQVNWMKRTLQYIQLSATYELRYDLKKGEIYEIDYGINVNSEFSNRHYGVVLVDSGPLNPLVMVCPLKTNHSGAPHKRSDLDLGVLEELGGLNSTIAIINQIRTIDKFRILRKNRIGLKKLPISIYEEDEVEDVSTPKVIRLNENALNRIIKAYLDFIYFNGIIIKQEF